MENLEITELAVSVITPGDAPWFSGHFPNNPILPGIAQLKMVADLIAKPHGECASLTGLSRVKFRRLVRPGERLDILVTGDKAKNQYIFKITSGNEDVCSGKMSLTPNKQLQIHE